MKRIHKGDRSIISTQEVPSSAVVLFELDSSIGKWVVPAQSEPNKFRLFALEDNFAPNRWNEKAYDWSDIMDMVNGNIDNTKVLNAYLFTNRDEMFRFILDPQNN